VVYGRLDELNGVQLSVAVEIASVHYLLEAVLIAVFVVLKKFEQLHLLKAGFQLFQAQSTVLVGVDQQERLLQLSQLLLLDLQPRQDRDNRLLEGRSSAELREMLAYVVQLGRLVEVLRVTNNCCLLQPLVVQAILGRRPHQGVLHQARTNEDLGFLRNDVPLRAVHRRFR